MRRAIQNARMEIDRANRRVADLAQDLVQRRSTRGEAFALDIDGRSLTQRKAAGEMLLTNLRIGAREGGRSGWRVCRIGGFDLNSEIQRQGRAAMPVTALVLQRCNLAQRIDIERDTSPLGLIARLEHIIDHIDVEIEKERRYAADAKRRLDEYEPRVSSSFALQPELDEKRAQLEAIEADLVAAPAQAQDEAVEETVQEAAQEQ